MKSNNSDEWYQGDISQRIALSVYKLDKLSVADKSLLSEALVRMGVYSDKNGLYHIKIKSPESINISDSVYRFVAKELERTNLNTSVHLALMNKFPRRKIAGEFSGAQLPDCMVYSIMHAPGNTKTYDEILDFCIQRSAPGHDWIASGGFYTGIVCGVLSDCGLSFTQYTPLTFLDYVNYTSSTFYDNPIALNNGSHMVNLVEYTHSPGNPAQIGWARCNDYQTNRMNLMYPFDSNIYRIWL